MKKALLILTSLLISSLVVFSSAFSVFAFETTDIMSFCNGLTMEAYQESYVTHGFNPTAHYNSSSLVTYTVTDTSLTPSFEYEVDYDGSFMSLYIQTSAFNSSQCEFFFNGCAFTPLKANSLGFEVHSATQFDAYPVLTLEYYEPVDDGYALRTYSEEVRLNENNTTSYLIPPGIANLGSIQKPLLVKSIGLFFDEGLRGLDISFYGRTSSLDERTFPIDELYTEQTTIVEEVYTEGFMQSIFGWIDDFLGIKLFGIGDLTISLGTILGVCLIIPIALWVLKMVAGG